jgi:hypothetical protein
MMNPVWRVRTISFALTLLAGGLTGCALPVEAPPADESEALGTATSPLEGVNALGVNALGVNALGVNALGVNALGVNALGVNAPTPSQPSRIPARPATCSASS